MFSSMTQLIVLIVWTVFVAWAGYKWGINHKDLNATVNDMKESAQEEIDKVKGQLR